MKCPARGGRGYTESFGPIHPINDHQDAWGVEIEPCGTCKTTGNGPLGPEEAA